MFILPFLALLPLASCWGALGHRTVGFLAQLHFTPEAASWVEAVLDGEDLADAIVWPDVIRKQRGFEYTKNWHFIDAMDDPPRNCTVYYKRDCPGNSDCVVGAIANHTARVQDPSLDAVGLSQSMKFVMHFFGDIHQPLHTEHYAKGGNAIPVRFDGKQTNLHSVWDDSIPDKHAGMGREKEIEAAHAWAERLYQDGELRECLTDAQTCALQWATEANGLLCTYVLASDVGSEDLGGDYYSGAVELVDRQIQRAGRRLAAWINAMAPSAVQLEL